jgi:multiple sugar transport system ATP-binding protein
VRPEHPTIVAEGFPFDVGTVESTGSLTYVSSRDGLQVVQTHRTSLSPGDRVGFEVAPEVVHLFDPETGDRVHEGGRWSAVAAR